MLVPLLGVADDAKRSTFAVPHAVGQRHVTNGHTDVCITRYGYTGLPYIAIIPSIT